MPADPAFRLTRAQVRELDRRAADEFGLPGLALMENAGRGCAELIMRLNPERRPTFVLCGPGNNGGDGFVVARHLDNAGWPVWVVAPPAAASTGGAAVNRTVLERAKVPMLTRLPQELPPAPWVVDALFGTGLARPLDGPFAALVDELNRLAYPVLAVDIPSGLDCDTGEPLGPTVRAAHTATFVAHKAGFANPKSREWTGEIHVVDIGAPRALVDDYRRRTAV